MTSTIPSPPRPPSRASPGCSRRLARWCRNWSTKRSPRCTRDFAPPRKFQDYQIRVHAGEAYVCVGGIRSTGLTASMAIAEYVTGLLGDEGLELTARMLVPETPDMAPLGEQQLRRYLDAAGDRTRPRVRPGRVPLRARDPGRDPRRVHGRPRRQRPGALRRRTRAMNGAARGSTAALKWWHC